MKTEQEVRDVIVRLEAELATARRHSRQMQYALEDGVTQKVCDLMFHRHPGSKYFDKPLLQVIPALEAELSALEWVLEPLN